MPDKTKQLVILVPDLMGAECQRLREGAEKGFLAKLIETQPRATIVPIINGLDPGPSRRLCLEANKAGPNVRPITSDHISSLRAALMFGYNEVIATFPEATVVRMDTAENPIDAIQKLADDACDLEGMAIGDLNFEYRPELMLPDSPDWVAHHQTFPTMYGEATHGALPLSGAHGFQAFAPGVIRQLLRGIRAMKEMAEELGIGEPAWGLDSAMVLSAYHLGVPVDRLLIPAVAPRNRAIEKIEAQTRAAEIVISLADQVNWKALQEPAATR